MIERAYRDAAFKKQLLSKPKEAIEEETGAKLPASLTVHVYEETATHRHFGLPVNPAVLAASELSDTELEQVAGGKGNNLDCGSGTRTFQTSLLGAQGTVTLSTTGSGK